MRITFKLVLLIFLAVITSCETSKEKWSPLFLAYKINMVPGKEGSAYERREGSFHPFSMEFAKEPVKDASGKNKWVSDPACKHPDGRPMYRNVSVYWRSDKVLKVTGISLTSRLSPSATATNQNNEIGFFFSPRRCYDGGDEYGWVYREKTDRMLFYLCGDCNKAEGNHWCQWPAYGDENNPAICKTQPTAQDDCPGVAKILERGNKEMFTRSIIVNSDGNFSIVIGRGRPSASMTCTLRKLPDSQFRNLYGQDGFITLNAKKHENNTAPTPVLEVQKLEIQR